MARRGGARVAAPGGGGVKGRIADKRAGDGGGDEGDWLEGLRPYLELQRVSGYCKG
jgi:hypothetical protein